MKNVYLDNAATTQIREEVIDEMANVMHTCYGNPSSTHSFGRSAKALVEKSRKAIAKHFSITASEIVFTSGGTEADNLVLNSAVRDLGVNHIITAKIEHHAVLHTIAQLLKEYKITVSYLDVDEKGDIDFEQLGDYLKKRTKTLVSLMHINNEIGNILDVNRVGAMCKANDALFHTDAVQSIGHYHLNLQDMPIDFLAASAHKFHGPKGIGFAFIRKNTGLKPLIHGGEQERGLRAGTESVHNIVGMEVALNIALKNVSQEAKYITGLKEYFISELKQAIPDVVFNGQSEDINKSTYTLVNVCLPIPPEKATMMLFQLDLKGVACSKGSACQSGSAQVSHVLYEILSEENMQKPSIRFSFSIYNTKEDIDYVVGILKDFNQG